jgi:hypothetical protein
LSFNELFIYFGKSILTQDYFCGKFNLLKKEEKLKSIQSAYNEIITKQYKFDLIHGKQGGFKC